MEYTKQNEKVPTSPPVAGYPVAVTDDMPQQQAWSTGLFNCFDDFNICCLTFWCPCISFGRIADIVDKGNTSCGTAGGIYALLALTGFQWAYSCIYRSRMRAQNNLEASPCADCFVHFCFESLALCQMSRELKNRGWDLNLGYRLNLEKKGSTIQQQAVVAPASQAMTR